jgi:PRTRC genetic system protein A
MRFKNKINQKEIEKESLDYSEDKRIKELKEKVESIKNTENKPVPYESQINFWHFLNDVQFGKFDPENLTKLNTWVITRNGTWLVQKNNSGYYGVRKNENGIPTLPVANSLPVAFFDLTYGKIPNSILQQIVAFFREIMKRYNDAEAFIQVYWDKEEGKYVCHVPKQKISKGSVKYDASENLSVVNSERYVFAYECHSHNSMGAFWSGTDNRDEKELRLYGVFGMLHQEEYANKHRFFVGEEEVDCSIDLIFDIPKQNEDEKKYVITHNNQQYMVSSKQLILDEKPKYVLETNGQKIYIPLEGVSVYKEPQQKVDYPESWFNGINVPFLETIEQDYSYGAGVHPSLRGNIGKNWDGGSSGPSFSSKKKGKARDPFYFDEDRRYGSIAGYEDNTWDPFEADAEYELMVSDISAATKELVYLTQSLSLIHI